MKFELDGQRITYTDHQPGEHATLFTELGERAIYDDSRSFFDNANNQYTWAFNLPQPLSEEDHVTFAVADRDVTGIFKNGQIVIIDRKRSIERVAGKPISLGVRIYVGAGPDGEEWSERGWLCNDIAEAAAIYKGIALVGPCWSLPVTNNSVDEILAKGMMEHLTYHEFLRALNEWKRVLKPGGFITIEVPDLIEYFRQYIEMRNNPSLQTGEGISSHPGEPQDFDICNGLDRWLRRALFGWQRWSGDEHRSGWTEELLKFYLNKFSPKNEIRRMTHSFEKDEPNGKMRHLWARAWKE